MPIAGQDAQHGGSVQEVWDDLHIHVLLAGVETRQLCQSEASQTSALAWGSAERRGTTCLPPGAEFVKNWL